MSGQGGWFAAPEAEADLADGHTAGLQRVGLRLTDQRLAITLPDGVTIYWPLGELRARPDQAGEGGLVLSRRIDPVERLYLSDPAFATRIRAHAPSLHRRPPFEDKGRIFGYAVGAVASVALIIFVLVPILAGQLAMLLPPQGEKALGDVAYEQIRTTLSRTGLDPVPECTGTDGRAAIEVMEARLNVAADLPYPAEVTVLDHPLPNAFALPGGRVVLFRGLIEAADTPEEVAAVFAHELGHVAARHPTRSALRTAGSVGVLGLLFGDFAGGGAMLMVANQLIDARYSRAAETEADDFAHRTMVAAGLDPAALGTLFARMRDEFGDADGLAAHFASHPRFADRIASSEAARGTGGAAGLPVLDAAQWAALQAVCDPPARTPGARGLGGRN